MTELFIIKKISKLKMKENKEYVENQIDTLSNEIIVLQDEIKFLEKEKDNFHYENE